MGIKTVWKNHMNAKPTTFLILLVLLSASAAAESFTVKYYGKPKTDRWILSASDNGTYMLVEHPDSSYWLWKNGKPSRNLSAGLPAGYEPTSVNNRGDVLATTGVSTDDNNAICDAALGNTSGAFAHQFQVQSGQSCAFRLNNKGHIAAVLGGHTGDTERVIFYDGNAISDRYTGNSATLTDGFAFNDKDEILFEAGLIYLSEPGGTLTQVNITFPQPPLAYIEGLNSKGKMLFSDGDYLVFGPVKKVVQGAYSSNGLRLNSKGVAAGGDYPGDLGRGEGAFTANSKGRIKRLNCMIPNNTRLALSDAIKVLPDGRIIVRASHMNNKGSGPAILTPEHPGALHGYCPKKVTAALTGLCATLAANPDPDGNLPIPTGTKCSVGVDVQAPDGKALANVNVALVDYYSKVVTTGKTTASGRAALSFTLDHEERGYYVIAPYNHAAIRPTTTEIYHYSPDV